MDEKLRTKIAFNASVIGILSNLILVIIKFLVGFFSSSVSIIGDAINNLSDLAGSIVTLIGVKISSKPADKEHPFGHERMEYIISLIIGIVIIVVGIELFSTSISKVINGGETHYSIVSIIVLIVSIFIKLFQGLYNKRIGKKINSQVLITTAKDSINDVVATSVILISVVVALLFGLNIDGYMGILVSIFIVIQGVLCIKETIDLLLGGETDLDLVNNVVSTIKEYEYVLGVHDVLAHSYGPTKVFMTVHVEVDSEIDVLLLHECIDQIEIDIKDKYNISLVIHMDPIDVNCEDTIRLKSIISDSIYSISNKLTFHDFRVVKSGDNFNVFFDLTIPYKFNVSKEEILKHLNDFVNDAMVKINITFDTDFN